jgi:hypothetical protein
MLADLNEACAQVVVGIPFYTERDNVVSQLVTLRQARMRSRWRCCRAAGCRALPWRAAVALLR